MQEDGCNEERNDVMRVKKYMTAPWLPIDTAVHTPFHIKHKKIPATFPMDNRELFLSNLYFNFGLISILFYAY